MARRHFSIPPNWTFGQPLYASQIEGVLQGIEGVEHVDFDFHTTWWSPWIQSSEVMTVAPNQIVEVQSDPSEIEKGWIDSISKEDGSDPHLFQ